MNKQLVAEFESKCQAFLEGDLSFDDIIDEITLLEEDEAVDASTYSRCVKAWERTKADDSYWQDEEMAQWRELRGDQSHDSWK